MRRAFLCLILISIVFVMFIYCGGSFAEEGSGTTILAQTVSNLSKLQTLIEFFYVEMGEYPPNLGELNVFFNAEVPPDMSKIDIPLKEPSGKPYIYEVSKDGSNYLIKSADFMELQLYSVSWGWMKDVAGEQRRQQKAQQCANFLKMIATAIEIYAHDSQNQYPTDLKLLIPRYTKQMAVCPASRKEYVYEIKDDAYMISCPSPELHGFEYLRYSSKRGLQYKEKKKEPVNITPTDNKNTPPK